MMAHTAGPWALDGDLNAMNLDVIYGSGRIAMMECENDELSDAEVTANARLICAAPDLLEALQWAIETADTEQYEADWYAAARAAIAKAKGDA